MEATESTEQGEWAAWKQAVEAGWRGEEPPRTHVELDGGEIVLPAFHPHRTVSSIRSRSEEPWRISVDIHAAAEVMPALIGGAEAVRLIGCDRPAAWLDGVIREYVDIEWVGDIPPPSWKADGLPVKGGLLLDWWSGLDLRAHLAAVQATGRQDLRVLLVTDEPARGWTRSARLALLVKAVGEAAPQMDGDAQPDQSMDLMLDRDPVIGLAQAEAFKRMASPLVGEGNWPRLRAVPDASDLSADSGRDNLIRLSTSSAAGVLSGFDAVAVASPTRQAPPRTSANRRNGRAMPCTCCGRSRASSTPMQWSPRRWMRWPTPCARPPGGIWPIGRRCRPVRRPRPVLALWPPCTSRPRPRRTRPVTPTWSRLSLAVRPT